MWGGGRVSFSSIGDNITITLPLAAPDDSQIFPLNLKELRQPFHHYKKCCKVCFASRPSGTPGWRAPPVPVDMKHGGAAQMLHIQSNDMWALGVMGLRTSTSACPIVSGDMSHNERLAACEQWEAALHAASKLGVSPTTNFKLGSACAQKATMQDGAGLMELSWLTEFLKHNGDTSAWNQVAAGLNGEQGRDWSILFDLLQLLLHHDMDRRITAAQALQHSFFISSDCDDDDDKPLFPTASP
jgi:serine/threonine protein kinase